MAVNLKKTRLAVGYEDGCIRLFDVERDILQYLKSFDRVEGKFLASNFFLRLHFSGRVLTLAWHPVDDVLVSGTSKSSIYLWNTKIGFL